MVFPHNGALNDKKFINIEILNRISKGEKNWPSNQQSTFIDGFLISDEFPARSALSGTIEAARWW